MNRQQKKELQKLREDIKNQLKLHYPTSLLVRKHSNLKRMLRLFLLAILVWLLWSQCATESEDARPLLSIEQPKPPPSPPQPTRAPPVRRASPGPIQAKERPKLKPQQMSQPRWISDFQLQVSTRSPELATCATGASEPGALRWSALLDPKDGSVSDQQIEGIGANAAISSERLECIKSVLRAPPYVIKAQGDMSPRRVTLLLEY